MRAILLPFVLSAACAQPGFVSRKVVERTIPAANLTAVSCGSHNGNITVAGEPAATEVGVRAELSVYGFTQAEADANLEQMSVGEDVAAGTLRLYGNYDQTLLLDMSPCFTFHLQVPRQMGLTLESHNGSVEARGTQGVVSMVSYNGNITAKVDTSKVTAQTHNGSVQLDLGSQGRLDGEVVSHNGNIEIALAEGTSTSLEASTHNGDIEQLRPLQDAKMSLRSVRGRVGEGQGRLSVTTHNGCVTIR